MSSVGKNVAGKLYAHFSVIPSLVPFHRELAATATKAAGLKLGHDFNVVRISEDGSEVALLSYPGFFEEPFPALSGSWRFDVTSSTMRFRDYSQSLNPPILHRKELLISSDHPDRARFAALTQAAESIGLFDSPTQIGYRTTWLELIKSKGYELKGYDFVPIGNDIPADDLAEAVDELISVQRHRTALSRSALSAPVQSLIRYGLLLPATSLFDYGCGRGSDLEGLAALGFEATGWDPFFRPDQPIVEADLVNLGFVINVIEDFDERVAALQRAFRLARQLLAVSAMLTYSAPQAARAYRDGVLSSRNTFQKYYQQEELRNFIEEVLDEEAVPVAPGIFYVFKDHNAEQRYLLARSSGTGRVSRAASLEWRRPLEARNPRERKVIVEDPVEAALADQLWSKYIELGRPPEADEIGVAADLIATFGSLARARRRALRRHDIQNLDRAAQARTEDIAVMLALRMFSKRRAFRSLGLTLQRDIKALFGSFSRAEAQARDLLFSVRDIAKLEAACAAASSMGLGWLEPGHSLQLHTSVVARLPAILRVYLGCATALFGDITEVDLVKLHIQSGKVTLMRFDNFLDKPLPVMTERIKVRLRDQQMDVFTYGESYPPPLLYSKSRFINEEFALYAEQIEFENALQSLGLFDLSGYGPPAKVFFEELRRARWNIDGMSLSRSTDMPSLDEKCGRQFTFRDLVECGETWKKVAINNTPQATESFNALADLARYILDPVVEYFGGIKLTYGFCSRPLGRLIKKGIAPDLDQHAAHDRSRTGRQICSRGGAAVDFIVEDEDMAGVANWIRDNLPFDRLYFYGPDRPIHVSYGPNNKREFVLMREKQGRRYPSISRTNV